MFEAKHAGKWRTPCGVNIVVDPDNYHEVMAKCAKSCKRPIAVLGSIISCVFDIDAPWVWYIEGVIKQNYSIEAFHDEGFCKSFAEWIIAVIVECETKLHESTGKHLNLGGIK